MIQFIRPCESHITLLGMIMSDPDVAAVLPDRFLNLWGLHRLCADIESGVTVGALVCIADALGVFFAEPDDGGDYIVHAYFQRAAWGKGVVEAEARAENLCASLCPTRTLVSYVPTFNRVAHVFNLKCGFKDVGIVDENRFFRNGEAIPCWKMIKEI